MWLRLRITEPASALLWPTYLLKTHESASPHPYLPRSLSRSHFLSFPIHLKSTGRRIVICSLTENKSAQLTAVDKVLSPGDPFIFDLVKWEQLWVKKKKKKKRNWSLSRTKTKRAKQQNDSWEMDWICSPHTNKDEESETKEGNMRWMNGQRDWGTQREPISSSVRQTHLYFTPLNSAFASVRLSPACWTQNSVLFPHTVYWRGIKAQEADPGSMFMLLL